MKLKCTVNVYKDYGVMVNEYKIKITFHAIKNKRKMYNNIKFLLSLIDNKDICS